VLALWSGPTIELGLAWRSDKTRDPDAADTTDVFGGAVGYERGTELVRLDDYTTMYTRPAPSVVATLEGYLRFGWTF